MLDKDTPRLRKHNGLWALRELRDGYQVARVRWPAGQTLGTLGAHFWLFQRGAPDSEFVLDLSDIKGKDWCLPHQLAAFRAATSTTVVGD